LRWARAASLAEVPEGGILGVVVEGRRVALARAGGVVRGFADRCTHEATRISEGFCEGGEVECPLHGARFDLETGEPRSLPATRALERIEVRVEGGEVQVAAEAQAALSRGTFENADNEIEER
jgi:nitrite reductase/ring-hydroxylating ferredoxin subunit